MSRPLIVLFLMLVSTSLNEARLDVKTTLRQALGLETSNCVVTGDPNANPIVGGSWVLSCTSFCIDSQGLLSGNCQDEYGQFAQSATIDYTQCGLGVANVNGQLTCYTRDATVTSDSFQNSCYSCSISGVDLTCTCPGPNGNAPNTLQNAAFCLGEISNQNGVLTCAQWLPTGNYDQSCSDCSQKLGFLQCQSCKQPNSDGGLWVPSHMNWGVCPNGGYQTISNNDGILMCAFNSGDAWKLFKLIKPTIKAVSWVLKL